MRKIWSVIKFLILFGALIGVLALLFHQTNGGWVPDGGWRIRNPLTLGSSADSSVSSAENEFASNGEGAVGSVLSENIQGSSSPESGSAMDQEVSETVYMEEDPGLVYMEEEDPSGKPRIQLDDWKYILANASHSVEQYEPRTEQIEEIELDYRIIEPMQQFVDAARNEGLNVVLASGYRSYDTQSMLYEAKVAEYGEERGRMIVNPPGTSEHQTGLAADITDAYYEIKKQELEYTDLFQWMQAHCQEYGFIVRYPKGKEEITGIIFEPWHFRYVGKEAAAYIMENNLTLEEFLDLYQ